MYKFCHTYLHTIHTHSPPYTHLLFLTLTYSITLPHCYYYHYYCYCHYYYCCYSWWQAVDEAKAKEQADAAAVKKQADWWADTAYKGREYTVKVWYHYCVE